MLGRLTTFSRYCHTRYRKKPKYGTRHLVEGENPYNFNAWDDVEWDEEREREAQDKVKTNSQITLSQETINNYEQNAAEYWNKFYDIHTNRFFKDRHWLFTEFAELQLDDNKPINLLEIGCGVGNTVLPILRHSQNPNFTLYCCDFSSKAIEILKQTDDYDQLRCNAFVLDVTTENWQVPFEKNSLDIIVLIFVLSAIEPTKFQGVIQNVYSHLKPGGIVLFRDYGRYDLAQLRFKSGQCLGDNFYVRGDGTRVYFFTPDEIRNLFESQGFIQEENHVDRRLQINRGLLLKMYRVWIQGKYRKP